MPQVSTGSAVPLRVLIVDDSAWLRRGIRGALERAGLVVVGEAADGGQALAQAAARRPDVVLMDLRMPEMDGIQATRALRHQQPGLRVVLWTGEDDAQLASAIGKSGAHAGVPKGVATVELIATLQGACTARPVSAVY
ncbi:MAG TPA: response regulator transcription factor [Actinomycetes bacterium]|jgi:DNA-binding NarL/FixJ family response regulator|nr:response regulator transcription factor [Actinomycetes bacterium]